MNNLVNWFTKKKIIIVSTVSFFLALSIYFLSESFRFWSTSKQVIELSFFLLSFIFVFSFFSFFIKKERLHLWFHFSVRWGAFVLLILLLSPSKCDMFPVCDETARIANFVGYPILGLFFVIIERFFSQTKYFKYLVSIFTLLVILGLSIFVAIIV